MKFLNGWIAAILAACAGVRAKEEVMWYGSNRLEEGERLVYQDGNCRLAMYVDGNFLVQRRIPGVGDNPDEWGTSWNSGSLHREGYFALELTSEGNLVIFEETVPEVFPYPVIWSTNIVGDTTADHEFTIDSVCRLKIRRNGETVWENIKIPPFQAGQVLQKGEMFRMSASFGAVPTIPHPFRFQYVLLLQHDCHLVQYLGTDNADRTEVVWASQTPRPGADNCYLYLDKGKASLYEGTFDPSLGFEASRPNAYWSTPSNWLDQSFYPDEVQESYQIVLGTSGKVFHWNCCSYDPPILP